MNKNDLRVIKTKKIFQSSLIKLLKEIPFEKIKVSELCREANVSRGTFYLHYETIQDVFEEYYNEIMLDLQRSYEAPLVNGVDKKGIIKDATEIQIFHHVKKYEGFYQLTFSKKIPIAYYYLVYEKFSNLLREIIQRYMTDPTADVDYYVAYKSNAIMGLILEWYRKGFSHSAEYISKQLYKIVNYNNSN